MTAIANILVGCDPEVFVKQNGLFRSAHKLIKGDKKHPQKVKNGAVQVDGLALEFNIEPAATADDFAYKVADVLNTMTLMVPEYEVVVEPVAHFEPEYMRMQPAEALELGCDPDFNAWEHGMVNIKPNGNRPMRTAAGHVHIGWTEGAAIDNWDHINSCHAVIKQMDFYLGLPSLMYDNDTLRREMYGKAGCYRPKSYGVEYRTLSNAWLKSEALMKWVFRATQAGMASVMAGNNLSEKYGDIQAIINSRYKSSSLYIIRKEGIDVCNG